VTVKSADDLRKLIREVPDFPKPGILFYDITTLLKDPVAFKEVIDRMVGQVRDTPIDLVVGMESRGFIFSAPIAYQLGAGFVPVRKLGKLPAETIEVEYALEYGTATLEIHRDAILNPNALEMGVGYAYVSATAHGGYYTVVFGSP